MREFERRLPDSSARKFVWALVFFLLQAVGTPGASRIIGSVRNESRGVPAAGDEVVLLRFDEGIKEEGRAKTDGNGEFAFDLKYPKRSYLVRVIHAGVSYDQRASASESLPIQVFDAAAKVEGITGSIEILRAGTHGDFLHVSDMLEIINRSSPPMTQAADRSFEVYLPANARVDSILAAGPERIATMISASADPREPGHYTLNFPLRPGRTKFAFNYDVPYHFRAVFQTRLAYPMQQLAVMLSPSMRFSSESSAFEILATGDRGYQVHAANQLKAGLGPQFVISGAGTLPPLGDRAKSQVLSQPWAMPEATEPVAERPNSALASAAPLLPHTLPYAPVSSRPTVLVLVTAALFAVSGLWIWRVRKPRIISSVRRP